MYYIQHEVKREDPVEATTETCAQLYIGLIHILPFCTPCMYQYQMFL